MGDSGEKLVPIPEVPKKYMGLMGNLPDIEPGFAINSIWKMSEIYGPIFQLDFVDKKVVFVSSQKLVKELIDDDRFEKVITGALLQGRSFLGDGIFSAHPWEKNWFKSHRILMPIFGPIAVRKMFDQQLDIASQMILRWDRFGPRDFDSADEFTRLAFDTIGLCGFSYRFNDFYLDEMHPFADEMARTLLESAKRANRTSLETGLRYFSNQTYWRDIKSMHKLCDDLVEDRIKNPQPELKDCLNVMLYTEDPETGEKLDAETIRYNLCTLLVAGHETTSATLGFLFHLLLKNPDTYVKLQQEVDDVLGDDEITVAHLPKLKYMDRCVKETLRIQGPLSQIPRHAKKTEVIGGKYKVEPDLGIIINLVGLHHDPEVWGDDADKFNPDRMLKFHELEKGSWHPFGVGMRACIGRSFAEQEILINVALILQRFQVEMSDANYKYQLKSTGTVKPLNFRIRVKRRPGKSDMVGLPGSSKAKPKDQAKAEGEHEADTGREIAIFYGSNAGTSKAYAEELATTAENFGISSTIETLDHATENIPTDKPVIIISPSYEGKPADNAKKFVSWLEHNQDKTDLLKGVKYAVFGVGNSEWASTYHKVPKLIDELMTKVGAQRCLDTGFVDVKTDPIGPFDDWMEGIWPKLKKGDISAPVAREELNAVISKADTAATLAGDNIDFAIVKENVLLADTSVGPAKRHLTVELPDDATYSTGDYLAVLPYNHIDVVRRVLARFKIHADDLLTIDGTNKAYLKTASPTSVYDFLIQRVELNMPITQRQIEKLAAATEDEKEKANLERYKDQKTFQSEVLEKRASVLDILETHPSCKLSFGAYLDLLKPMALRQYSISSSPFNTDTFHTGKLHATITYDVYEAPAMSNPDKTFHGVASSFLAKATPGSQIHCAVRSTNASFHLPKDPKTPVIMFAAGTGIAPMRGFIEERAAIAEAQGKDALGPALLYFGCRDYEGDYIYKSELEHWQELGAVNVRPCFSKRGPDGEKTFKYVGDRLWEERNEVADLFAAGAKIFVCGSASKLAKSCADTCKKIWLERNSSRTDKDADEWLEKVKEDRYVSDVFG